MNAMCTHLPANTAMDDYDTVDLHQKQDNKAADHLYTARKFWVEEREGNYVTRGGKQFMTKHYGTYRIYQVDSPDWLYRRVPIEQLAAEVAQHPKVLTPSPQPTWEYFTSRRHLEESAPHLWEIVRSMTERFHMGENVSLLIRDPKPRPRPEAQARMGWQLGVGWQPGTGGGQSSPPVGTCMPPASPAPPASPIHLPARGARG